MWLVTSGRWRGIGRSLAPPQGAEGIRHGQPEGLAVRISQGAIPAGRAADIAILERIHAAQVRAVVVFRHGDLLSAPLGDEPRRPWLCGRAHPGLVGDAQVEMEHLAHGLRAVGHNTLDSTQWRQRDLVPQVVRRDAVGRVPPLCREGVRVEETLDGRARQQCHGGARIETAQ